MGGSAFSSPGRPCSSGRVTHHPAGLRAVRRIADSRPAELVFEFIRPLGRVVAGATTRTSIRPRDHPAVRHTDPVLEQEFVAAVAAAVPTVVRLIPAGPAAGLGRVRVDGTEIQQRSEPEVSAALRQLPVTVTERLLGRVSKS